MIICLIKIEMKLLLYASLLLCVLKVNSNYLKEGIELKLHRVLGFIDEKYKEFHFDGLLGVTLARAFLQSSLTFPINQSDKLKIITFINKCQAIHEKMYPLLPEDPKYMIVFRNKLLDANKWGRIISNSFTLGEIKHLGYYKNWTSDVILANKKATYKGLKSDTCLREILELSEPNKYCYISRPCRKMMLDVNRIDEGYLLTHRLLYLQVIQLQGCKLPELFDTDEFKKRYCSYIHKEALTSELLGYPYHDIFLEQVVFCGMEGYAEFLNEKWLKQVTSWQNPYGCYESIRRNKTKRTSFTVDFGCSDHTTGLAAAALALNLRFVLWPNIYDY